MEKLEPKTVYVLEDGLAIGNGENYSKGFKKVSDSYLLSREEIVELLGDALKEFRRIKYHADGGTSQITLEDYLKSLGL